MVEQGVLFSLVSAVIAVAFTLGRYSMRVDGLEKRVDKTEEYHHENLERLRAIERELHAIPRG